MGMRAHYSAGPVPAKGPVALQTGRLRPGMPGAMRCVMELTVRDLPGRFVTLETIREEHREPLRKAAADPAIWTFLPVDGSGPGFDDWFDSSMRFHEHGEHIVYTVHRLKSGTVIGSTRFLNIERAHKRVEIGYTWYATLAHGGPVNPECKFLLLNHAFDAGANRVELKTDARNDHSRAAIAKLGGREEGTLRAHMVTRGGYVRDSVYFSVIRKEWPDVRDGLLARLG